MSMRIYTTEDPILRVKCSKVAEDEIAAFRKIAKEAAEAMYVSNGCGIAAPQVGLDKRFCVVDVWWDPDDASIARQPIFLFNPEITRTSDETVEDAEGCLSVVGVTIAIERPERVKVEYTDENGERAELEADGKLARCLQHEIDHLDGITIVERAKGIRKLKAIGALAEAKKRGLKQGDKPIFAVR